MGTSQCPSPTSSADPRRPLAFYRNRPLYVHILLPWRHTIDLAYTCALPNLLAYV